MYLKCYNKISIDCWVRHSGGVDLVYGTNKRKADASESLKEDKGWVQDKQTWWHSSLLPSRRALKAAFMLIPLFGLQMFLTIYRPQVGAPFYREYEYIFFVNSSSQVTITTCIMDCEWFNCMYLLSYVFFQGIFVSLIFCFFNSEVSRIIFKVCRPILQPLIVHFLFLFIIALMHEITQEYAFNSTRSRCAWILLSISRVWHFEPFPSGQVITQLKLHCPCCEKKRPHCGNAVTTVTMMDNGRSPSISDRSRTSCGQPSPKHSNRLLINGGANQNDVLLQEVNRKNNSSASSLGSLCNNALSHTGSPTNNKHGYSRIPPDAPSHIENCWCASFPLDYSVQWSCHVV